MLLLEADPFSFLLSPHIHYNKISVNIFASHYNSVDTLDGLASDNDRYFKYSLML